MRFIYLLIAGMALVLSIPFGSTVQAETSELYVVGTGNASLLVRDAPSGEAEVTGYLSDGEQVAVYETRYGWARIYFDNQTGWVALHYLYPVTAPAATQATPVEETAHTEQAEQTEHVTVIEDGVRVRTGPGTDYPITYITNKHDTYPLLATSNNWHQISLPDGSSGWLAAWLTDTSASTTTSSTTNTNTVPERNGYTVVLDAGHGGKDPGAIALNGSYEKDFALQTADEVASHLEASGVNVIRTRNGDSFLSLEERVRISEAANPDLFISLHYNASHIRSVNGISTFHYQQGSSRNAAWKVQQALINQTGLHDRGTRQASYRVLRKNDDPAVLVELGFLSNPEDLAVIQTETYRNQVAKGITEGVTDYFKTE